MRDPLVPAPPLYAWRLTELLAQRRCRLRGSQHRGGTHLSQGCSNGRRRGRGAVAVPRGIVKGRRRVAEAVGDDGDANVLHSDGVFAGHSVARDVEGRASGDDKVYGRCLDTNMKTVVGASLKVASRAAWGAGYGDVGGGGAGAELADCVAAGADEGTAGEEHRAGGGGDLNTDELLVNHIWGARDCVVICSEGCAVVDEARHCEEDTCVGIGDCVVRYCE